MFEYSSREMKPAVLLLQDLLQAHSTFLLHHASSMSALFVKSKRSKFIGLLARYWDTYIATWDVLLRGNPAVDLYGGIKVAASGELGVGVGEESRGSAERDVLEGFVRRIDGLVDVYVAKFGDGHDDKDSRTKGSQWLWLGSENEPGVDDGAIFLGTGSLSRKSLQDISHWVQDLYRWGPHAYGVIDNPTSNRRPRRRRNREQSKETVKTPGAAENTRSASESGRRATSSLKRPPITRGRSSQTSTESEVTKAKKFVNYLKLGYGTHWTLSNTSVKSDSHDDTTTTQDESNTDTQSPKVDGPLDVRALLTSTFSIDDSAGHYLIGLMGRLSQGPAAPTTDTDEEVANNTNSRVLLRTLTVELERAEDARAEADISIDLGDARSDVASSRHTTTTTSDRSRMDSVTSYESQDRNKTKKLRVVVYASKPFIFVFLFEVRTESLAFNSLYHTLHAQLQPLIKPLLKSTQYRAPKPEVGSIPQGQPVYDLLYNPTSLTVHASIPNIPLPGDTDPLLPWTRSEAVTTHSQILSTYQTSRADSSQLERSCKTNRGWWVVWTRIPNEDANTASVESEATSLSSGQVKIPTLITEDSTETIREASDKSTGVRESTTASKTTANPPPLPASTRTPNSDRSRGRVPSSRGVASTLNTSIHSGPAWPSTEGSGKEKRPLDHEVWLIRRERDDGAESARGILGRLSGERASHDDNDGGKLAHGIGIDTKRYIENLLGMR